MSYSKTVTTVFNIRQIGLDMFTYDETFRRIRGNTRYPMKNCHKCSHSFADGEKISLAIIDKGNKVLCKTCAEKLASEDDSIEVMD